jgi:hypothetical protein
MRKISHMPMIAFLLVAFIMSFFVVPSVAEAKWRSNAEVPEGTNLTPYLVVGGILIAGVVIYAIVKHNSNKDDSATEEGKGIGTTSLLMSSSIKQGSATNPNAMSVTSVSPPKADPLHLYLDVRNNIEKGSVRLMPPALSDVAVRAGISFGF